MVELVAMEDIDKRYNATVVLQLHVYWLFAAHPVMSQHNFDDEAQAMQVLLAPQGLLSGDGQLLELIQERRNHLGDNTDIWYLPSVLTEPPGANSKNLKHHQRADLVEREHRQLASRCGWSHGSPLLPDTGPPCSFPVLGRGIPGAH